jgi:hypothetical protein
MDKLYFIRSLRPANIQSIATLHIPSALQRRILLMQSQAGRNQRLAPGRARRRHRSIVLGHDTRLLVVLVQHLVLEERLGVGHGHRAVAALVGQRCGGACRAGQVDVVVDHDARLLVVLVELLVLEEGLGVHDGVGALVALVGRVEVQPQVLHVLAVLLLAERVLEVLGDVELELGPAVVAVEGDVKLGEEEGVRGGGRCGRERVGAGAEQGRAVAAGALDSAGGAGYLGVVKMGKKNC